MHDVFTMIFGVDGDGVSGCRPPSDAAAAAAITASPRPGFRARKSVSLPSAVRMFATFPRPKIPPRPAHGRVPGTYLMLITHVFLVVPRDSFVVLSPVVVIARRRRFFHTIVLAISRTPCPGTRTYGLWDLERRRFSASPAVRQVRCGA